MMNVADYPAPISNVDDLPKNYDALPRERFWQEYWLARGTYKFDPARPDGSLRSRDEIFSIDTPPPTVSGQLHIGHVYSYTQTDMNARYRRMSGKHVFYPFGFDDNGLPTERLVEKEHGIRAHEVSREEFIALCQETAAKYEAEFIALWQSLALSCDWEQYYTTIDERSRAISQASFIDLYNKGYIYRKVAPTQWDWVNQTAIAQAEIEDREVPGHFHYIKFQWADGPGEPVRGEFVIGTTRPELIPACVAVMANPKSEQILRDHEGKPVLDNAGNEVMQRDLIGKIAITPLFEVEVPILPSEKADPEKGTGVLMCCTFGDMDDVEHWERFGLPTRVILGKDGRFIEGHLNTDGIPSIDPTWRERNKLSFVSHSEIWEQVKKELDFADDMDSYALHTRDFLSPEIRRELTSWWSEPSLLAETRDVPAFPVYNDVEASILGKNLPTRSESPFGVGNLYAEVQGRKINDARAYLVEKLQQADRLLQKSEIQHVVRHSERGNVPVEILVTPQWYVSLLKNKQELIEHGRKINWHPAYMLKRFEQWVDGLNADWCISRQRFNGVPFPVWYSVASDVMPELHELPVNPLGQMPPSVLRKNLEMPDGFTLRPETDVMDTWATSSVTPLLNTHFRFDASSPEAIERHGQLFPYDMRPQAHDIIRTWAFYTIAKAYFHFGEIPWKDIVISGHAQDAGKQKMSKSKGNIVTPAEMVEKYSADGLRYWSGGVKLGTDTIYDETKLGEGRKLINKLFNATKFALRHLLEFDPVGTGVSLSAVGPDVRTAHSKDQSTARPDVRATADALTGVPTREITYPTDLWLISRLNTCIERATAAHEAFEFGDAKQAIEDFFWADLCDNYLEFSKGRLYGEPLAVEAHPEIPADALRLSAQATLYIAFSSVLRMLAPTLPHITEECWSWYFAQWSEKGSIHLEEWPTPIGAADSLSAYSPEGKSSTSSAIADEDGHSISGLAVRSPNLAAELLIHTVAAVRKWKSERGVSIKTPLSMLHIYRTDYAPRDSAGEHILNGDHLHAVLGDLMSTCNARQAFMVGGDPPADAVTTERSPVAVVCELAELP